MRQWPRRTAPTGDCISCSPGPGPQKTTKDRGGLGEQTAGQWGREGVWGGHGRLGEDSSKPCLP